MLLYHCLEPYGCQDKPAMELLNTQTATKAIGGVVQGMLVTNTLRKLIIILCRGNNLCTAHVSGIAFHTRMSVPITDMHW